MNTNNIARYVWLGKHDQFWYSTAHALFNKLFGHDEQRIKLVCELFAATSINTSLKSNVTLFRRALHEYDNNLPFSNYLPNIKQQLEQIRKGTGSTDFTPEQIEQFKIDWRNNEIPTFIVSNTPSIKFVKTRMRSGGATDNQYTLIESWVREEAKHMGIHACMLSAMIWSGCRIFHSGDKQTKYTEVLLNQLYNMFDN